MDIVNFIIKLRKHQIFVKLVDGDLKVYAPKGILTKDRLEEIKEKKEAVINFLSQDTIPRAKKQRSYALTPQQKGFWVLSKFDRGNEAYNISNIYKVRGNLQHKLVEKAFQLIIERHESLRTFFLENEEGEVRQSIVPIEELNFKAHFYDFNLKEVGEDEIKEFVKLKFSKPFLLTKAPLLDVCIIKENENEFILIHRLHHIIGDGWSMEILFDEFCKIYDSLANKTKIQLSELKFQFKDYSEWLNSKKNNFTESEKFWLNEFSEDTPSINLPSTKKRPLIKTFNGDNISSNFSTDLTKKIDDYAKKNRITPFAFLMASVKALVYRYTNITDITVGTPIAGRGNELFENQIGLYLNTFAIRTKFEGDISFNRLVEMEFSKLKTAYSHQDFPFDMLLEKLPLKRDVSRSPIFDIMLALQSQNDLFETTTYDSISRLSFSNYPIEDKDFLMSKFDLTFNFVKKNKYTLFLEYNTDIFEKKFIERFVRHLQQFICEALRNPEVEIGNIDYLAEEDKHEILINFNNTSVEFPKDETLISLIQLQVKKNPNKVAINYNIKNKDSLVNNSFHKIKVTYTELEEQSNRFAHFLENNYKVRNHDLVGLELEKSEWLIPVLLGILKLGGAYVPIDPEYPKDRKKYFAEFTNCKVIVTETILNDFKRNINNYSASEVMTSVNAENLVHIMFTSGSTGRPKGVMLNHRNILGLIKPCSYMELNAQTILLSNVSISFDTTNMEFWGVLANGGEVILAERTQLLEPFGMEQIIRENNVDTMFLTSSWFESVVDENIAVFENLKQFLTGGDIVSLRHINKLVETYPKVKIIHCYGPTEDTTFSTTFLIKKQYESSIPIGVPIDNSKAYILNEFKQVQPIGVPGILYLSGVGLAQGYYNNKLLTKERFIENPFLKNEKMYNTGDYAKWNEDGTITFIGRIDRQVKIRGKIIDTVEIENTLTKNKNVNQSLVEVRTIKNEKVIVAFIACESDINLSLLKNNIKTVLPEYMIPQLFVTIPKIPLSPNGKADRKKLPDIDKLYLEQTKEYFEPITKLEKNLVNIWQEILKKERISINDDFFELGGHSLKAIRLLSEYNKVFQVKLSLPDLFSKTRLEEHIVLIKEANRTEFKAIPKIANSTDYEVSSSQYRLWVLSQFEKKNSAYNIPYYMPLTEVEDIECLEKAISSVIDRHEILRTVFFMNTKGDLRQKVVSNNVKIGFVDLNIKTHIGTFINEYIKNDSYKAFNLETGPLVRGTIFKESENNYGLYFNIHHIVSDGWSMEILYKDVMSFYKSYIIKKKPDLPKLNIQYRDFAAWQNKMFNEAHFAQMKSFWLNSLKGELPLINLPTNKVRPRIKTHSGVGLHTYISKELTKNILVYSKDRQATLFMFLISSVKILLHKYTGLNDIIIGTPIAGREHSDLKNQIGFYINSLVLRSQIKENESFSDFFESSKKKILNAYKNQSYPFDRLIEDLELTKDTSRNAIFDVMVVLQNAGETIQNSTSLNDDFDKITVIESVTSKRDITINFQEIGESISVYITYNSDVYDRATLEGFIRHYKILLGRLLEKPTTPIGHINFLSVEEENQLINVFNTTEIEYPKEKTIIDLFAVQVYKAPEDIALVFKNKSYTYKQIDAISNQFANYLISNYGIKSEDCVGISLDRSDWVIIAMLGIVKAGGAYVPIDPDYPKSRISYLLKDSKCKALINERELHKFTELQHKISVEKPQVHIAWNNLVYVIYTSGSTGDPKGVKVENRGLVNHINWYKRDFSITPSDSTVQITSYAFDGSVTTIWSSLLSGATLHMISSDVARNPEACLNYIEAHSITFLKLVPSLFSSMVATKKFESSTCLKTVKSIKLGGENIVISDLEKCFLKYKNIKFANHYGATEATIGSVIHHIDHDNFDHFSKNPVIGSPYDNFRIYILDAYQNLVPIGVTGMIYIAGDGVSRGYLNNETLNKEKFVSNIFGESVAYKSGDYGCWTSQGTIQFKGRRDDQVKIRGHRIELGEIENAFNTLEDVKASVVTVFENKLNDKEIVAYYVSYKNLEYKTLREYLKSRLPEYMLPAYFIRLDEIPLTANGKVNKTLLPDYKDQYNFNSIQYTPPVTELQKKMVALWEGVLERKHIGIHDNFFESGGHSLKAVRLINQIEQLFKIKIKIEALFTEPTVEKLSEEIERILWINSEKDQNKPKKIIEV